MRDYNYCPDGNTSIPISQMHISDIRDVLNDGAHIIWTDGLSSLQDLMDRLRIELLIRELGL